MTDIIYLYNADGQRVFKKVDMQAGEHYIMDGSLNVGVFDENGLPQNWNIVADGVAGRVESGGKLYYLKDHLGSTRAVVNESGTVTESHDYYPFGLQMPGRDSLATSIETKEKFTGKEKDVETGLDYFGLRYYDPSIGRWLSPDPLAEKFLEWSPYNYTLNNPINNFDPDGLLVRSTNKDDLEKVAEFLNKHHEGADIKVVRQEGTNYYVLQIGENSAFDFGTDNITAALFDVIVSDEITFDVVFQEAPPPGKKGDMQEFGGGYTKSFQGGATIYLDPRGHVLEPDYVKEDVGVVFMHEAVGHGHPFIDQRSITITKADKTVSYTGEAAAVNAKYTPYAHPTGPDLHGGYRKTIGWKKTGLWQMSNLYFREQIKKGRKLGGKDR